MTRPAAFLGFGHPAVITVACVLVLSWGLQSTGAVDALASRVLPSGKGPIVSIAAIASLGAALSAFMNNVGAMALLMPLAIQLASKLDLPPGKVLMPLSFGTILGGMTTLIGTPPNLIVSGFRAQTGAGSFGMFDFSPVGVLVAGGGLLFLVLAGWRLVPRRMEKGGESFATGRYLTEARVRDGGKAAGKSIREVEEVLQEADAQIVGMVRNRFRVFAPNAQRVLRGGDVLVIEAEPESLSSVFSNLGLVLAESGDGGESRENASADSRNQNGNGDDGELGEKELRADEIELQEWAVMPNSLLIGRSAQSVGFRTRFGINLLAISRRGRQTIRRLRSTTIQAGDVLLLQGAAESLSGFGSEFGCVPLAGRSISIPDRRKAMLAIAVLAAAIAGAAFGLVPAAISFASGVVAFMVLRVVPMRKLYEAIDWPVIVLLGAMIPIAVAMERTGLADLLAQTLLENVAQGHPVVALALILAVTMTLSDFMNNAATAISTAAQLGTTTDAFLMAVAVGASCAFLTPIGHQNNTLILGPGGFRFGDYWRLGLPMEILVVAVAIPGLLYFWPL